MLNVSKPIVTVEWLLNNINHPKLVILDATMRKVTWEKNKFEKSNKQIPKARFFDIKNIFSDTSSLFPNMMLAEDKFQVQARNIGINKDSVIVVYDSLGIYTSPRVWWMFKSMGHNNIVVLDGGFPEWLNEGFQTEEKKEFHCIKGDFEANYNPEYFSDKKEVLNVISDKSKVIIDARSEDRFLGIKEEPRKNLRSGHIPSSYNIHYNDILKKGKIEDDTSLIEVFDKFIAKDNKVIFTCGSGITACILALGAESIGYKNVSVYDGSWTEWGSLNELPISN